jgi:hypothetical protein
VDPLNNNLDAAAEQGLNLALVFFIIASITLPLARFEQLTTLQNKTEVSKSVMTDEADRETALLEVAMEGKDSKFYWRDKAKGGKRITSSVKEICRWIEMERPDQIRLRYDRRLPSASFQDLIVCTGSLNINLQLSTE